jgi:hypothetical protein
MKVTGQRATTGGTTSTKQPARTPKEKKTKVWPEDDGFETPVPKTGSSKKTSKTPRAEVSAAMVDAGSRALARDRRNTEGNALRDAGWLLGGLTASVVINVIHQFQRTPVPELDATVQRLGELCGALFVEFLGGMDHDVTPRARAVAKQEDGFLEHFEASFGMSPLEATARFVDFIARTEGFPRERLRGSIYG